MRADGSSVDIDQEAATQAENGLHYEAVSSVMKTRISILKSAIGSMLMGLFDAIGASGSGLTAERMRMDVTSENLANAETTKAADGQPYRRKEVVLQEAGGAGDVVRLGPLLGIQGRGSGGAGVANGVKVSGIVEDSEPAQARSTTPGHPDADKNGYVTMPNVNTVTEMTDLISSSRAYEANVTAMQTAKTMFSKTLDLLR